MEQQSITSTTFVASKELTQNLQRCQCFKFKPLQCMKEPKFKGSGQWIRKRHYQFAVECITDKIDCNMKASGFLFISLSEESEAHLLT